MEKVLITIKGVATEIDVKGFEQCIAGIEKDEMLWPALNCIACGEGVFARGIRSPSQKFTAHFSHRHEAGESCPLSSKTTRFRLLSRVPSDPGLAQRVRSAFYTFEKLRDAYLICRHLRGGEGMLKQEAFLKMVQVADSYGIWGYTYMPARGIPLLLMLMDNHRTRKDTAYFYSLVKPRSHFSETWWHNNIILQAHWADTGNVIRPTIRGLNAGFRHQIVFSEATGKDILEAGKYDWATREKLVFLDRFCRENP